MLTLKEVIQDSAKVTVTELEGAASVEELPNDGVCMEGQYITDAENVRVLGESADVPNPYAIINDAELCSGRPVRVFLHGSHMFFGGYR